MTRHPRLLSAFRGFASILLCCFLLFPVACERTPSPNPAPETAAGTDAPPPPPAPEPLLWTDLNFKVFKGIPARVHFSLEKDATAAERAATIETEIRRLLDGINGTFNAFDSETEVGRFNASTRTEPLSISEDFARAVELSQSVWKTSEGGFDVTVWPLKVLWNAAKERKKAPTEEEVAAALALVGMDKLDLNTEERLLGRKVEGLSLDFGGIIKGYAVDRLCDMLKEMGVANALVQVGGEIRVFGLNPEAKGWVLGIQHPVKLESLFAGLAVPGEYAVSSSGNYRQPIVIGKTTYYHIFDPKTGYPVPNKILGITVMVQGGDYPNARADAWATALTTVGVERGLELAREHGFGVLFLVETENDKVNPTLIAGEGIKPYLILP